MRHSFINIFCAQCVANNVLHCAAKYNTGQQCAMMMCNIGKNAQHYVTMYYIVQQLNRVCMRGNWMRVSPVHN